MLNTSVRYIKGIGPKKSEIFQQLGINTIEDLLYCFPRRYEDRSKLLSISQLKEGEVQTIKARILAKGEYHAFRRRGFSIIEVAVGDDTGKIFCVWFNQPFLSGYFKVGQELILYGKVQRYAGKLQMNSPEFEFISEEKEEADKSLNAGRIVPVYSLPQGLTQRGFRKMIKDCLDKYTPKINDFLPYDMRSRNNLLNLAKSLVNIHFPTDYQAQKEAYRRLSFEEFLMFQIPLGLRKLRKKEKTGICHFVEGPLLDGFFRNIPFKLTDSQEKVITEIKIDMSKPQPMQRLLQGDVGSGKTVVAASAALIAMQGRYQVAFMVPTEILAKQHYEKISLQFKGLRTKDKTISIGLLIGSLTPREKNKISQGIKEGKIDLVIGTHALLEKEIVFKNLGLVIIDEQHKFGVSQRALLSQKTPSPDTLIMTATPIPRTLAITLYGDLDISVITELPPGRKPIKTMYLPEEENQRAYILAREHLIRGSQAYIVYPVIEESYALDMAGAKKMYEELKSTVFKEFRVGLIHGRLKQVEQDGIMSKFRNKELDILISTTVLEVGIDVPSATCMIIQYAERFGLSQLHQLRGRIGRGREDSLCILVSSVQSPEAKARLQAMVEYNDGFRIAEEDLKIRGPGEFFGDRQHGLTELRIANPLTQMQLLKRSREEAIKLLNADPQLQARQNILLKEKLLQRFPEYEKLILVG